MILWILLGLVVSFVLVAILWRRRWAPPACPAELDAVEKALAALYDDVKIVRIGHYISVRAKSKYIPVAVIIDCKRGEVETEWPWQIPVLLLFAPNLQLLAILLLLWIWDTARSFRNTVLHIINEGAQ